ncbi:hypothetical protein D3C87_898920 [compost metagenome]
MVPAAKTGVYVPALVVNEAKSAFLDFAPETVTGLVASAITTAAAAPAFQSSAAARL